MVQKCSITSFSRFLYIYSTESSYSTLTLVTSQIKTTIQHTGKVEPRLLNLILIPVINHINFTSLGLGSTLPKPSLIYIIDICSVLYVLFSFLGLLSLY